MRIYFFSLCAFLALLLIGCQQKITGVENISVQKLNSELKEDEEKIVLDVRTPDEYTEGHIKGAVNIDVLDSSFEKKVSSLDANVPIYVYCRSGVRSSKASKILIDKGFKKVYNLDGGIKAWENAEYQLAK